MSFVRLSYLVLLLFILGGCMWFGHLPAKPAVHVLPEAVSLEVIREDLWAIGGGVAFIPFTPGAGAEAGSTVDRLSLMIVKGLADAFAEKSGAFYLLTEEEARNASFVIEGRIEEFTPASKLKIIGLGKKYATLKIKGEIREQKTGEVVALIFGVKNYKKNKDSELTAYDLGRSLGEKVQH
ncbi:MAG: hypothetical protein HQL20_10200 [Candidatus Omnitrophica bacterium]|nr:hypothetical protein [Candidatus Omnitrophota bacterium]